MASKEATKSFDIILFGATSYVGAITAEYILVNYGASPPAFKWALAARSKEKLEALKERLALEIDSAASSLPTILANSNDEESLDRMVSQAKVVITTVGPYMKYGSKLVAACVRAGVHYCDLTAESFWVKDMIDKHHDEAQRTGAKIVMSCGFDSILADMGVLMMMEHMEQEHGIKASEVRYLLRDLVGGPSGGTMASVMGIGEAIWNGGMKGLKSFRDPLLLAPASAETRRPSQPGGFGFDTWAKVWTAPNVFVIHDSKVVYRSAGLLDYGGSFNYKESTACKGVFGFFVAMAYTTFFHLLGVCLWLPPLRKALSSVSPAPGEGPPKEVREKGYFWVDLYAKARADGNEVMIRGVAGSHHGDCGYTETAKMVAESGLCLVLNEKDLKWEKGGVLTPATAMGAPLLERLREAGMTFKVVKQ